MPVNQRQAKPAGKGGASRASAASHSFHPVAIIPPIAVAATGAIFAWWHKIQMGRMRAAVQMAEETREAQAQAERAAQRRWERQQQAAVSQAAAVSALEAERAQRQALAVEGALDSLTQQLEGGALSLARAAAAICDTRGEFPLHRAARAGDVAAIAMNLALFPQAAARRNRYGATPFHRAASGGHIEAMRLLMEAAPETLTATTNSGATALHILVDYYWSGREPALRWLLQAAPQLAVVRDSNGASAIHVVAKHPQTAPAVRLLASVAPELPSATDSSGRTPMHYAAGASCVDNVRALLELAPQTVAAQDMSGQTPLHVAAGRQTLFSRYQDQAATLRLLFEAAPAHARVPDSKGQTALELLLAHGGGRIAAGELGVRDCKATQELLQAARQLQPSSADLQARIMACLPLAAFEWASLPPAPLAAALPAVLEHSLAQARLLVAHLPPANAARLRTLALSMARVQQRQGAPLPLPILQAILVQAGTLLYR